MDSGGAQSLHCVNHIPPLLQRIVPAICNVSFWERGLWENPFSFPKEKGVPPVFYFNFPKPLRMRSGVMGSSMARKPVACFTASAMAGAVGMARPSPASLAP